MKTLVIFDIDGTLVYSNKIDSLCFSQAYQETYHEPFPTIDWRKYPHVTDHTIFRTVIQDQFGRIPDAAEMKIFQDRFVELINVKRVEAPEEFFEVPGAKATIDRLIEEDNIAIGIATGGWERPARIKLAFVNINMDPLYMSFADNKVTREDIINESIALAKVDHPHFDRIVYVGDAIWDVTTTRNMQMPLIGIRRNGDLDFMTQKGVKWVFADYHDFDDFRKAIDEAEPPLTLA